MNRMNLEDWLDQVKNYSLYDIEVTVLELEAGMELPEEVRKDLAEYRRYVATTNKRH